ncbi:MAG: hypothetical protein V4521_11460 [Pseudomonadota bacterium]
MLKASLAGVLLLSAASQAIAGEAGGSAAAQFDPFAQAMAARTVADYARRTKDPAAMLTAARMLGEVPVTGTADADADATFTPAALFAEARTFASGDALLLQQIRIAESSGHRGVLSSNLGSGLVRSVQLVNPLTTYQFRVTAKGGDLLRIGAIGDLGTNLVLRVTDNRGKVACLDDQGDYAPVCQTRPSSNGEYRVDVINKSSAKSRTVILSN